MPISKGSSKPYLNTPFKNPETSDITEIEVTDPRHPLFGNRFLVLSIRGQKLSSGHVFVSYRDFASLRIPIVATDIIPSLQNPAVKLSFSALRDFIALAEECNILCPSPPSPFTKDYQPINNKKFSPPLT